MGPYEKIIGDFWAHRIVDIQTAVWQSFAKFHPREVQIQGVEPKIVPFVHRVFHEIFTLHFGVFKSPYFWETTPRPISVCRKMFDHFLKVRGEKNRLKNNTKKSFQNHLEPERANQFSMDGGLVIYKPSIFIIFRDGDDLESSK